MKRRGSILMFSFTLMTLALSGCHEKTPEQPNINEVTDDATRNLTPVISPEVTIEPTTVIESITNDVIISKDIEELAKEWTESLIQGDVTPVYEHFTDELKAQLSIDDLKEAYEQTVLPLGRYIGIGSVDTQEYEQYMIVGITTEYQNNGLLFTYTFNQICQLEGIYMSYQSIEISPEQSEHYTEEEIQIGKGDFVLDGILTLPTQADKPPVVILVQGSGQSDMDETIGIVSNKPFRDLAYGLAKQGIATIRYNKRYYQYMDQIPENMTVKDEILDDVSYAIEYAIGCQEVNNKQIFIAGHSLGGMLAPKIASDNTAVKGIVVLAGSPRKLEDIIYDQAVILTQQQQDTNPDEIELYLTMVQENVSRIKNLRKEELAEPILGCMGYYWDSLNNIDTPSIVQSLTIPMLFLQGSSDFQVFADKDFVLWEKLLSGHDSAKFIQYEGLNHLFMPTTGIIGVEDYNTKNNISSQVIDDIAAWLKNEIK